jgi:hypothetical protein
MEASSASLLAEQTGGPMTSLAAWGPTVVMALATLVLGGIALQLARRTSRVRRESCVQGGRGSSVLLTALRGAESANAYQVASSTGPMLHLKPVIRLRPVRYQDGVIEIPKNFQVGYVVSVDLSQMRPSDAARLVDFCSGYLTGTSGWLFRATNSVIVLTPARDSD